LNPDRRGARAALGVPQDAPVLAVLPGSRLGEIARLGPDFLDAATRVAARVPGLEVLVPAANAACREALAALLPPPGPAAPAIRLLDGSARAAMVAADVVLLASGTATLEAMLAKRPMVVGYRIAPTTHRIVKGLGLLKVDRYALPNVLAGETLAPELMQDACTAEALADAVLAWFHDPAAIEALEPRYRELHLLLRRDASRQAAEAVSELLDPAAVAAADATGEAAPGGSARRRRACAPAPPRRGPRPAPPWWPGSTRRGAGPWPGRWWWPRWCSTRRARASTASTIPRPSRPRGA